MLSLKEIQEKISRLNGWSLENGFLQKNFELFNFNRSITFLNKIAEVIENNKHYPDILIRNNLVKIRLITSSENQISEKDFLLAEEIDKIEY